MGGLSPVPRLVIGAPHGRSGKTTVTVGLAAALAARGLCVQPFKKGPDYIDPSWLSEAAGRPCRNLDPFLMGQETVQACFERGSREADIALVEGAMGLYDGLDLEGSGSTAMLARWLNAPILLVAGAQRITRSAAALVLGYQRFEPNTPIAGVILNGVARARHESILVQSIERYCGIPVVGILPRDERLAIPDRHLGLVPRGEDESLVPAIAAARQAVEAGFDLDRILHIANFQQPVSSDGPSSIANSVHVRSGRGEACLAPTNYTIRDVTLPPLILQPPTSGPAVGVVRDRAFSFYYPENLQALQEAGARLVFFDSLRDARLPAIDLLYIGGGFPEVMAAELEANTSLRSDIRQAIERDLPVYAECGGLMYLARGMMWNGRRAEMVGALPVEIEVTGRPQGHGYVELEVTGRNPFFAPGMRLRGHEFHHSRVIGATLPCAYTLSRGAGLGGGRDGLVHKNVLAAYTHLHAAGSPEWAGALVAAAKKGLA